MRLPSSSKPQNEVVKLRVERAGLEEERRRAVTLRDELERAMAEVRGMRV